MTNPDPQAAPGPESTDASATPPESDDDFRRHAIARLAENLDLGADLLARCEHFANLPKGNRLNAVFAAARLMNANAAAAKALAQLAQVERRQRTIVERIQPSAPVLNDSNSILQDSLIRDVNLTMLRYMKLVADEDLGPAIDEASGDEPGDEDSGFDDPDAPGDPPNDAT
jgi:hypothetical protein